MVDPLLSLLAATALLSLSVLLLWPVRGLVWRWRAGLEASDRVRVEDSLKHLWECEYRDHPATLQSLAGTLRIDGGRAADLVERLERLGLAEWRGERLLLTGEGRRDALRVVRIHRLWERWLADETGLDPREWHPEAERREHRTSAAEADVLAATLGHPRFDPHGDPIPMASGELPPRRGVALTALDAGQDAEIVHVEDEPEAVFAQLAAAGLAPGMRVRVLERDARRIRLAAATEEVVLAPVVAANLTVVPIEAAAEGPRAATLSSLGPGGRARVVGISAACRGTQRRRLLDLGFVPGTEVVQELVSPGGDPTAYRVRGALLALRREQADLILVEAAEPRAETPAPGCAA
jgi:DtxR family Mn-dependent transcriptional regulator